MSLPRSKVVAAAAVVLAASLASPSAANAADRDHDGLTDDEELLLGTRVGDADTDDDGLLDGWEVNGYSTAGFVEPLPAYGADPLRKDVFVELDWMESAGESSQLNAIIAYQAAVDVTRVFRDSGLNVQIHFDLGPWIDSLVPKDVIEPDFDPSAFQIEPDLEKVLPFQESFSGRPECHDGSRSTTLSLYDVYSGGRYFRPSRRNIFYYVAFAEQWRPPDQNASSAGRPFTDSFSDELAKRDGLRDAGVQVGVIFRRPAPDLAPDELRYHYSVALLHELGHAFGFGHGGSLDGFQWDNTNWKPNYPSVMNYRFQSCGVQMFNGVPVMGFSHGQLSTGLDESNLRERVGLGISPSLHLFTCLDVTHIDGTAFPTNVDWNRDGVISDGPISVDVNENGRIDGTVFRDHDDWGKLEREGFDGIGLNAFGTCGLNCAAGADVRRLTGDFNGDGRTDLFLTRGDMIAWAVATADGRLTLDPGASRQATIANWRISAESALFTADLLGTGRDMVFAHRAKEVAVIDYDGGVPRLRLFEDGRIEDGAQDLHEGWDLGPSSRFLNVKLSDANTSDIVVTDGHELAILQPGDASRLVVAWKADSPLTEWTGGGAPRLLVGRTFADGHESLLVSSASSLVEVTGPAGGPGIRVLDRDGVIPSANPPEPGWVLSAEDCIYSADVDGDSRPDLLLHGDRRLGLVRVDEEGARLVWHTEDNINGILPLSRDRYNDRLFLGQFVPGGGEEIVFSNGFTWVTMEWSLADKTVRSITMDHGFLASPEPGLQWELRPGQVVIPGRFLPGRGDGAHQVLVQDERKLTVAQYGADGFQPLLTLQDSVGDWALHPHDVMMATNIDGDPEDEILVRNVDLLSVIDFLPEPATTFLERIDVETLQLRAVPRFRRGDTNVDGIVDLSDAVLVLAFLFQGGEAIVCQDAADVDDSGTLNLTDPIRLLIFLFSAGEPPATPGPYTRGVDLTSDDLPCA